MSENVGIYVHIPFCMRKCSYCDFVSYAGKEEQIKTYIEALKKEIKMTSKQIEKKEWNISTVYIGGGTPSFIDSNYIIEIMQMIQSCFEVSKEVEVTIEVNPGTVTIEKLKQYRQVGINRISIGLQVVQDSLLKKIGRIHTYAQFLQTYQDAKLVGFTNQNVDLMLGLPGQTLQQLEESVKTIIDLEPTHISVYSLIIEENTPMEKQIRQGKLTIPEEALERIMYWRVKELLQDKGYLHYEISNFAKKGYYSKHNQNCWGQKEYLGFGVAAHSYFNKKRYSNEIAIEAYIKNIQEGKIEKNKQIHEIQNKEDEQKEYMLLGLRKLDNGVSIQNFKQKFGENPLFLYHKILEKLVKKGLIEIDLDKIMLTKQGIDLANLVWEEFV
ncbi:MAG: radical SAM family heme chaperone HemW [Clostridia bacterium]